MDGYAFDNFDLLIEAAGEGFRSRVLDSPAGQASSLFQRPFSSLELENFFLKLGQPRQNIRRIESYETQAAKLFGGQLFRSVFSGEVYACFLSSLAAAKKAGKGLRIRLRIDSTEFLDLPWELLYNPNQNQFISLSADTPVVRYLETSQSDQALVVQPPLRVLAMISSPEGYPPLDIDHEWRNLNSALAPLVDAGLVLLERLERPTLAHLQQRLRRGPVHIFHFIGHGKYTENEQEGKLLLEDENGRGRPVSGQFLGTLLHDHHSLRLAVLNACEGARTSPEDAFSGVAHTLIQQGLPAIIAMQFEITDTAAITFSREFYSALADGYPVDAAVSEARKAIFASGNETEWGTPVLYMRTPQGVIFEIPEQLRLARPDLPSIPPARQDRERQAALDRLFTEGLAAFWVEDWEEACLKFEALLREQPGHADAAARLKEARHRSLISQLYEKGSEQLHASNYPAAVSALEQLHTEAPGFKDSSDLLEQARRKLRLSKLYQEARELHQAGQWQAVIKVFEQITALDPAFPDTENLLESAQNEVAEIDRLARLNDLYSRAVRALDTSHWAEARLLLEQVRKIQEGFLQTERLLKKAEAEIARAESEEKRSLQINTLYEQAFGLVRSKSWRKTLDKIEEIRALDPDFVDREGIAEKARSALEQDETEAQRQSELAAAYARAVQLLGEGKYQAALDKLREVKTADPKYPDRQRVQSLARRKLAETPKPIEIKSPPIKPRTLWTALGGLITIAAVVAAVIFLNRKPQPTVPIAQPAPTKPIQSTPAPTAVLPHPTITPLPFTPPAMQRSTDPTLYDGFDDAAYTGSFNLSRWTAVGDPSDYLLRQFNGNLYITVTGNKAAGLDAQAPHFDKPFFLEARMFLDPDTTEKESFLFLVLNSPHGASVCGVYGSDNSRQWIRCWSQYYGKHLEPWAGWDGVSPGWHVFRFEVYPESMDIVYFVDGQQFAVYRPSVSMPEHWEEFKRSTFSFSVTLNNTGGASAPLGSIDYVRMGAIEDDPTLVDNFNSPAYDGSFDRSIWGVEQSDYLGMAIQKDGVLIFTQGGIENGQALRAVQYWPLKLQESVAFEASLNSELTSDGFVVLRLTGGVSGSFGLHSMSDVVAAHCWNRADEIIAVPVGHKTWHRFRIEVNVESNKVTCYIDGRKLSEDQYQALNGASIYLEIRADAGTQRSNDTRPMVGYVDDIRVLPLKYVNP